MAPKSQGISMNSPPSAPPARASTRPSTTPPSASWHQLFRRPQLVRALEAVQDLIAVSLCMGLFCVMALQLKAIFSSLLTTPQFHELTADILLIVILTALFRLLIINLQEQRVSDQHVGGNFDCVGAARSDRERRT
jgi:hypothetical protein